MDKYRIDSHKLMFHPGRVGRWRRGEAIYPLYVEVSPSGACNHRCVFCAFDYVGYRPRHLDSEVLKKRLTEMAALGVKSVMFGGEGEPFMNRGMVDIVRHGADAGLDLAATTNGVLFSEKTAADTLHCLKWIKFSVNAGSGKTYARIHRTSEEDFERVLKNLETAARLRAAHGLGCVLGAQILLIPENRDEVASLASRIRDIGLDYLVVKPYSHHLSRLDDTYADLKYGELEQIADDLATFNDDRFSVIFRLRTMQKLDEARRPYDCCLALPFWAYLDAAGDLWGCSAHLGNRKFHYGNVMEDGFEAVWMGERRRASLQWTERQLDLETCRRNCRMDDINRYLWELNHPGDHVNFI